MRFKQKDKYHLVSECGNYTIAKVTVSGGNRYEAWDRHIVPGVLLGRYDSADEAKAAVTERSGK